MFNILYYIASVMIAVLFSVGVYLLSSYAKKLPTSATEKTMGILINLDHPKNETIIDKIIGSFNKKIVPLVSMDESRRYRLERALDYCNSPLTPEEHVANSFIFGIVVGLLTLITMLFHPLFAIFTVVITPLLIKMKLEKPEKQFDEIRESIEIETAQFSTFIADALKDGNRNVLNILTSCKDSVSTNFRKELERTITDMKTGNHEKALMNMSSRMNLPNITQIVTGLIGVLKGNDEVAYFEALAEKFKKAELVYVKKKNSLKPARISRLSIFLIVAVVGQIMAGVILALLKEIQGSGLF